MRRIARTLACLASAWLLFACSSEPSAASGQDASVPDDAESDVFVDADVGDTAKAETSPDACEPYCHWDCSGGPPTCFAGQVWRFGRSPRPCCHYADPWPGPGPTCSTDVVGSCASGCAPSPDPRYAVCGAAPAGPWITYCAEGGSKSAGAPCTTDTECRPAADGIAALRCDLAAKECVIAARPEAPASYGTACPLAADAPPGERLIPFAGSDGGTVRCYVARDEVCTRTFVTTWCRFDEDCPEGSVCVCAAGEGGETSGSFCLPKNDRTRAGRIGSVPCAPVADAGADG